MKILLLVTDVYKEIGGGQTVYKKIIESSPKIEFHYFRVHENDLVQRPANCRTHALLGERHLELLTPAPHQQHFTSALERADRFARSVAGERFDIVEMPDFFDFGGFIRAAFEHHRVSVRRFVLALHGTISRSIELNWGSSGDNVLEVKQLERLQFDAVDGAYGISPRYIAEWQRENDRTVHFIDPSHFVVRSDCPDDGVGGDARPSLFCIGRSERRKGNDLFVELVRWLNPFLYDRAEHIGSIDTSSGRDSCTLLADVARQRDIAVAYRASMDQDELCELFARASVTVLPVRFDSLNLVALESLFNGCPLVISSKAGVCDYLDQYHPDLPYLKIDFANFYRCVADIEALLADYPNRRQQLRNALEQQSPWPQEPLDMGAIYAAILNDPARKPTAVHGPLRVGSELPYREKGEQRPSHAEEHELRRLESSLSDAGIALSGAFPALMGDLDGLVERLKAAGERRERNGDALWEKLQYLYFTASNPILRCNFWLEIARVERLLGNPITAAAYELRALRLVGEDRWGLVPRLTATLREARHADEAEAVEALYGEHASPDAVYSLLKKRFEELRKPVHKPLELCDDRRSNEPPTVAVIVSLYNAADKLDLFLTMLCRQTLLRKGQVELILVDSGSPSHERRVFEDYCRESPLNAVYARSADRETIQAAWNRGIRLARAPYLVFLGVDETIYPETLEMLAKELDEHPKADWVMANSLVTEVETTGVHKNDVMTYNRTGAVKDHIILETCYVSWVAGMYRASIHDRFGYYDENFRGAGDTEFKNRILPYINVRFVDRLLGLFLNYPEGQTTASPMAEIEDTRAWYMFRTPGGVRYLFENRPIEEAEDLLLLCLGYRKSYCGHTSTDFELGSALARYILTRKPHSAIARLVIDDIEALQQLLQKLEFADGSPNARSVRIIMLQAWLRAKLAEERHRIAITTMGRHANPEYNLTNDNRFEQHSWLWKSTKREQ